MPINKRKIYEYKQQKQARDKHNTQTKRTNKKCWTDVLFSNLITTLILNLMYFGSCSVLFLGLVFVGLHIVFSLFVPFMINLLVPHVGGEAILLPVIASF